MSQFEQLQDLIATTLRVPLTKVTETTLNEEIPAWDSLGHVNLMIALEQSFDLALDVEDFPELTSVPAILRYLRNQKLA